MERSGRFVQLLLAVEVAAFATSTLPLVFGARELGELAAATGREAQAGGVPGDRRPRTGLR